MSLHDEHVKIDPAKWEVLTAHIQERTSKKLGNCDVANALTEHFMSALGDDDLYTKLPEPLQQLWQGVMHTFAHYAFEYGRQYELDQLSLPDDFDDLTVEDL